MPTRYQRILLLFAVLTSLPCANAQEKKGYTSSPRRALTAPELLDAPDEWVERSLGWAHDILDRFAPQAVEHPVRRAALIRLDDVLHIESAPRKHLVQQFYRARMEKAVREIEAARVVSGIKIWKLYNHGFLVRTPSVSLAFDIVPGTSVPGFTVETGLIERLAEQSDVLFISHQHGDHANIAVARLFLDRHKPVIVPPGLWTDQDIAAKLTYLKRSTEQVHSVPIHNGRQTLKVVVYPGHQGEQIANNVYLVTTPEGSTVVHTGDQSGAEGPGSDFDWIDQIGQDHQVDVLMPNCWTTDIKRMARGVNPKLIITGHENEMGHTVDHREDYTQTYNRLFGTRYPYIVMTWGEAYHYCGSPAQKR